MSPELTLSRSQVRRIDELAQSRYRIPGIILMENAGRGAAQIINEEFGPRETALVVCGTGNNGGDGLVIARHLKNAGWHVRAIIVGEPARMTPDCATNDRRLRALGIEPSVVADDAGIEANLHDVSPRMIVVDALLGTGFTGIVRPTMVKWINRLNALEKKAMVAVDVPSGLDCDTGLPGGAAIQADLTITFVAMKPGFRTDSGRRYSGRCRVVDIGVPAELVDKVLELNQRHPN